MNKFLYILFLIFFAASTSEGSFIDSPSFPLQPGGLSLIDECMSATSTSGNVCELGWQAPVGTTTTIAAETGRPGIARSTSLALVGNFATLYLRQTMDIFLPAEFFYVSLDVRPNSITTVDVRVGVVSAVSGTPTNGVYLEALSADTNWFCVTTIASVSTRTDTGVAKAAGSFIRFIVKRLTTTTVACSVDGTQVSNTTNIPTVAVGPALWSVTQETVSKSIDLDYMYLTISQLAR